MHMIKNKSHTRQTLLYICLLFFVLIKVGKIPIKIANYISKYWG